jgi:hypothetical protein
MGGDVSDGALKAASSEMENVAPLSAPLGGFCPQLLPSAPVDRNPRTCAPPGRVRSKTRDTPPSPEEGLSANPRCRDLRLSLATGAGSASPRRLAVYPMAERADLAMTTQEGDVRDSVFCAMRPAPAMPTGNIKCYQMLDMTVNEGPFAAAGYVGAGRPRYRGKGPAGSGLPCAGTRPSKCVRKMLYDM